MFINSEKRFFENFLHYDFDHQQRANFFVACRWLFLASLHEKIHMNTKNTWLLPTHPYTYDHCLQSTQSGTLWRILGMFNFVKNVYSEKTVLWKLSALFLWSSKKNQVVVIFIRPTRKDTYEEHVLPTHLYTYYHRLQSTQAGTLCSHTHQYTSYNCCCMLKKEKHISHKSCTSKAMLEQGRLSSY